MGLQIPAGFCQAAVNLSLLGDPEGMQLTYGLEVAGGIPTQSQANALHDLGNGTLDLFCGTNYTFENTTLLTQTLFVQSTTASYNGNNAGDLLPSNCATLVTKRTGLRGRINTGRMFVPGIEESAVNDSGSIDPTTLGVLQAAIAAWSTAIFAVTDVTDFVLLHTSVTDTPTPVTQLVVEPTIATQRGRLRR